MPYTLTEAKDVMKIREREYGEGTEIHFTNFTTCLGVIATNGTIIRAVHLSLYDKNHDPFDEGVASDVIVHLLDYDRSLIVGHVSTWIDRLPEAYHDLVDKVKHQCDKPMDGADGGYGARLVDGRLQLHQAGYWTAV
jgi:hypothetical protein